jgi:hypothetical protein
MDIVVNNTNGYFNSTTSSSVKNGFNTDANKADDNSMLEVLKKSSNSGKISNGHYGSSSSLTAASGGLPGVRGRTRQPPSNPNGTPSSTNNGPGKPITTDTEEDETLDFLLKSAMTMPKGQPPKKKTKKYGDRKSCKLS